MTTITVFKRNHRGERVWSYSGELVNRGDDWICIDAYFNRDDVDTGYVVFKRGDRMTEWFYSDRWYNIFRLEDAGSGHLKGWYCNITRPAHISEDAIAADDLALDVFIDPAGGVQVLDEDEFAALDLPPDEQRAALAAVTALKTAVQDRAMPFDEIRNE